MFASLLLLSFTFLPKTHNLSSYFAIPFIMLIHLVYLKYCKMCDQLSRYQDTDLAYLKLALPTVIIHCYRIFRHPSDPYVNNNY